MFTVHVYINYYIFTCTSYEEFQPYYINVQVFCHTVLEVTRI